MPDTKTIQEQITSAIKDATERRSHYPMRSAEYAKITQEIAEMSSDTIVNTSK